jgi:hypothetical protein
LLAVALAVVLPPGMLNAQGEGHSSTITVDFDARTISPANPTMNIKANSSVVLEIKPSKQEYFVIPSASVLSLDKTAKDLAKTATDLKIPTLTLDVANFMNRLAENPANSEKALGELQADLDVLKAQGKLDETAAESVKEEAQGVAAQAKKDVRSGSLVVINFDEHKKCPKELRLSQTEPPYRVDEKGRRCDDWAEKDNTGKSWYVHLADRGARDYAIVIDCPTAQDGKNPCIAPITVALHIENALYAPTWGAGFSFTSLRDQRVRLDENPADTKTLLLRRLEHDDSTPTQVAAYLHYCSVKYKWEWLCLFNAGLATDLKESIQIMAGLGIRVRSIPLVNSAYLTIGPVYGSRKVLNDDYVGRRNVTVPATTTAASLLRSEQSLGAFVGLSFGFFESEKKFAGVYTGKSKPAQASEKADKP